MTNLRTCAVPDCDRTLYDRNWTGVCRIHNHAAGYCQCTQCTTGQKPRRFRDRLKSRETLVAEGKLPSEPIFNKRREPGMPTPPWEKNTNV